MERTRNSKKLISAVIDVLHDVADNHPSEVEALFPVSPQGLTLLGILNVILAKTAEGATLVVARDEEGTLNGFALKREPFAPGQETENADTQ